MAAASGGNNPVAAINDTPMGLRQMVVVFMMVLLNALDGFDVLSSAFAAPGIAADWGLERDALGILLSAELVGMGFGSGMLAATNAVVAETTSKKGRSISMALYVIGYPLGGVIGGFAAQGWLLVEYDWRAVFLFGSIVTAAMIPLVILLVPETPAYFVAR